VIHYICVTPAQRLPSTTFLGSFIHKWEHAMWTLPDYLEGGTKTGEAHAKMDNGKRVLLERVKVMICA